MAASTWPRAKAALLAALQASPALQTPSGGLPPPLVCRDGPGTNVPPDVVSVGVMTNRATSKAAMVGSGGAGWLDETYELQVIVSVFRGGDAAEMVDLRVAELEAAVEATVRADPSLAGTVLTAYPATSRVESSWDPDHKGRVADLFLEVSCQAQI